jgi:hypothetical protein
MSTPLLIQAPDNEPQPNHVQTINPMAMLDFAVRQGADIEKLSKLMDLRERWEKDEARKAFVVAMSQFKSETITVAKDKFNKQYDSKYVSLGQLVGAVTPYLSKYGLSARWDIDQSSGIKVSCIITHVMGHSDAVSMIVPPDKSGAKNPIQEIKSAITYAKACTFESACGLAATDGNVDDDGNGTSEQWIEDYVEAIRGSSSADELKKNFSEAYQKASKIGNKRAMAAFIKTKDDRKKEVA